MCVVRNSPHMEPSPLNRFFVVERSNWIAPLGFKFTKEHSCYLRPTARVVGVGIDYREREQAQNAADACNAKNPEGDYQVYELDG